MEESPYAAAIAANARSLESYAKLLEVHAAQRDKRNQSVREFIRIKDLALAVVLG